MRWEEAESGRVLVWRELSPDTRQALTGKLAGLWDAPGDESAFNSLSLDKQQALLLLARRLDAKDLWHAVRRVQNVYGDGGVGLNFVAWPYLENTLSRRDDFTRRFAKRKNVRGGFYEKGRRNAALHFLYHEGSPRRWHVHFDLYNPVFSLTTALRHMRHEYFGKLRPDWRMIVEAFK